jgi:hypothetical protein
MEFCHTCHKGLIGPKPGIGLAPGAGSAPVVPSPAPGVPKGVQ